MLKGGIIDHADEFSDEVSESFVQVENLQTVHVFKKLHRFILKLCILL